MSCEIAIRVQNLCKCYQIYEQPLDRLKQFILPQVQRMAGRAPKKYFRDFWALRDISCEVNKGETVGIIGRNGSGKSTLLQIICGTLNPSSGTAVARGRVSALLELGSGFNPEFTGRENVFLNAAVLGLTKEEINSRFDEIMEFAGIGDFIDQPVKTYSSGMLVRLAFSVAVSVDPEILVVDEALSVGDELFQRKCFSRIEKIRAGGSTILFVSHSGAQVIELCDRAILLDAGEVIFSGQPRAAVALYQKLLYAPHDKKDDLRSRILSLSEQGTGVGSGEGAPFDDSVVFAEEDYDPSLVPSSTIEFESHGPRIELPYILSLDGRKVNGLIRGRKYRYCYRVFFERSAAGVRFGMSIKSTTGLSLAGAQSAHDLSSAIGNVAQGDIVDVEFTFVCNFNPGVFFMNAGVFGLQDGQEMVLHRRADIIAFRVLPVDRNIETEVVSLSFSPSVRVNG
jgi:lipopolysaccharide transport system ATP-binding protein